jgi:hypothetical protein
LALQKSAHAQHSSEDKAASEVLFREARTLMKRKQYADACGKFAESDRLGPGIGVMLNLADCQEKIDRTASAWANFLQAAERAHAAGDSEREKLARARAAELEPRLARLVIRVAGPDAERGIDVLRDGVIVGKATWDVPAPVDPGKHLVEAAAPGMRRFSASVVASEGSIQTVTVELVPDRSQEASGPRADSATPPPGQTFQDSGSWFGQLGTQRAIALASAGIGVTGIAVGSVFGLLSKSSRDEAYTHCINTTCDPIGVELRQSAKARGNWSTASFLVGALALTGAGILWFTDRPATSHPQLGLTGDGIVVRGNW